MGLFGDFPGFPGFNPMAPLEQAGRRLVGAGVHAVEGGVSRAVHGVTDPITGAINGVGNSVNNWLGSGPNTSDAATAHGGDGLHHDAPQSMWSSIGQSVGDFGRGIEQEGLGGLLSGGMMDWQQAQRDLSDRFQVVGDDYTGPRASNQVSQAEYQNIARTFSNVRRGEGDLSIDSSRFSPFAGGDRATWEEGIQGNIADMMMTTSGRQQINNLSNNVTRNEDGTARTMLPFGLGPETHHHTTIQPLFGESSVDENGRTQWSDPWAWNRDASTLRHDNAFAGGGSHSSRDAAGVRGTGDDSTISINPGNILGLRSDVVMAHEMQHALHQTQGTMGFAKFGSGADTNINNSERQAVGLSRSDSPGGGHYPGDMDGCTENTYRQERNLLGDRFVPRTQYSGATLPGEAPAGTTDAQLQAMWDTHNGGPNVPHPAAP